MLVEVAPPESNDTCHAVFDVVSTAVADQKEAPVAPGKAIASTVGSGMATRKSTRVSSSFIVGRRQPVRPSAGATAPVGQWVRAACHSAHSRSTAVRPPRRPSRRHYLQSPRIRCRPRARGEAGESKPRAAPVVGPDLQRGACRSRGEATLAERWTNRPCTRRLPPLRYPERVVAGSDSARSSWSCRNHCCLIRRTRTPVPPDNRGTRPTLRPGRSTGAQTAWSKSGRLRPRRTGACRPHEQR